MAAPENLEEQLRNMILTNVTIGAASDQPRRDPPNYYDPLNYYHQNPRGRGRGWGRGRPYSHRPGPADYAPPPAQQDMQLPPAARILQRPQDPGGSVSNNMPPATNSRPSVAQAHHPRPSQPTRNPYANGAFQHHPAPDPALQIAYLDHLACQEIPKVDISEQELEEKEAFRLQLEAICQKAFVENYTSDIASIKLVTFGSLASGFATPGSDMDLALVLEFNHDAEARGVGIDRDVPRLLEQAVLDAKMGGRLLTRTRVPILKVCQSPTEDLYKALCEERQKWDRLPEDEKYPPPAVPAPVPHSPTEPGAKSKATTTHNPQDFPTLQEAKAAGNTARSSRNIKIVHHTDDGKAEVLKSPTPAEPRETGNPTEASKERQPRAPRQWQREKKLGPLDFPKSGVGIQCDINFENTLGIHNTQLLRCYALSDPRVRPMVLFVKAWAKRRKINSAYSGTLSSYGWVLMVLHYLVNIASPPVCPNLQSSWRPTATRAEDLQQLLHRTRINGYAVRFWRDEAQILQLASTGQLSRNTQSIGELLRGFFHYFASLPYTDASGQKPRIFYWGNEVLSLRTPGGIRQKTEKGWTRATTTYSNGKEVRQRYLFSIEDPFELDHNVARTVTHDGIVAIRDELRRAGRILTAIGTGQQPEGGLFDEVVVQAPPPHIGVVSDSLVASENASVPTEMNPADEGPSNEPPQNLDIDS